MVLLLLHNAHLLKCVHVGYQMKALLVSNNMKLKHIFIYIYSQVMVNFVMMLYLKKHSGDPKLLKLTVFQFCEHSPSHAHRAVHSSAAFLHLQRPTQPFLHLHDTNS